MYSLAHAGQQSQRPGLSIRLKMYFVDFSMFFSVTIYINLYSLSPVNWKYASLSASMMCWMGPRAWMICTVFEM